MTIEIGETTGTLTIQADSHSELALKVLGPPRTDVALDECSQVVIVDGIDGLNEARPLRPRGSGSGRKYRPSIFSMLALAAGASLEPMTLREAIHGFDEAEPPKPKTARTTWATRRTYAGVQQYHVGDDGEAVPVRLNDPVGNLKDRRKLLKQKQRSK